MAVNPRWIPPLEQTITTDSNGQTIYGDVYFDRTNEGITARYNVYSLNYTTTFTMVNGTFTIPNVPEGVGPRDTDVPIELVNMRATLIGVIPLININPDNNKKTPIVISFPTNSYAISVVTFERDYYVIPQPSGTIDNSVTGYINNDASSIRLPYRNALVINGIYNTSGAFVYGVNTASFQMEIRQAEYQASGLDDDTISYNLKRIVVPITITKTPSSLAIKPFTGTDKYTITNSDANGVITREYLDSFIDLNFSDFATTTRKNVLTGTEEYNNIIYYLKLTDVFTFQYTNDYITINANRITFNKVTISSDGTYIPIPIKFLQEETAIYQRSTQRIGDSNGFMTTIKLNIIKSTPTFDGQVPFANTGIASTVYRLEDLNKMTTERSFIITPPKSNNTDPDATYVMTSSDDTLLKIELTGSIYTAYIYGAGVVVVTITQPSTTNFNEKSVSFNVNIFNISPSIINCNFNLFYTNPYNRAFWTRFKPECRSSNLIDSDSNIPLTVTQVDEVYDMRRKAEILKYNKNVGGLTKSQKYAKASRGELIRKIGNESNYLTQTIGGVTTLLCPPSSANSRILCGLTSACGVPGKERLLCYDQSINLYNYKRTYQYQAGSQVPSNIQTTILTEPTNLQIKEYDTINNKITLVWDAPNSNGGLPIVGYVITYSKDNKTWEPYKSVFPYNPVTASVTAGTIASANATATGADSTTAAAIGSATAAAVIAAGVTYNPISGEINGNSVIFERIPGLVDILSNTVYYISVFSGNERGLSSIPATITIKTSSTPSIISDFGFTNSNDERQNLMVDLKWTDPINIGNESGSFNGPPITQYNLYYRKVPETTWIKNMLDLSNVITGTSAGSSGSQSRRFILRNLENQNKYDIKIEPINAVGVGPESAIITARTLMKPSIPMDIVLTAKYGLLPLVFTDVSRNYINITWNKPDTGGSPITIYYITFTPSDGTATTILYNVASTDTQTSFSTDIGRLGQNELTNGVYSVVLQAYNGYLISDETSVANVTIKPTSTNAVIVNIIGYYTAAGLDYADMTFTINNTWIDVNKISTIRVNGLNTEYSTNVNIFNQEITGTGEHKIRIPSLSSDQEIINVGQTYFITITLVFSLTGEERTSEVFTYIPEIRYSA
jgi:hypothetical protein